MHGVSDGTTLVKIFETNIASVKACPRCFLYDINKGITAATASHSRRTDYVKMELCN